MKNEKSFGHAGGQVGKSNMKPLMGMGAGLLLVAVSVLFSLDLGEAKITSESAEEPSSQPILGKAEGLTANLSGDVLQEGCGQVFACTNWLHLEKGSVKALPVGHEHLETRDLVREQKKTYLGDSLEGLSVGYEENEEGH